MVIRFYFKLYSLIPGANILFVPQAEKQYEYQLILP